MENNTNKAIDLAKQLEDSESRDIDLYDDFKRTIFNFLRARTGVVGRLEGLRHQLNCKLSEQLLADELSFDDLMKLYTTISNQINEAANALIGILRPVPGAESVLAKVFKSDNETGDAVKEFHDSLSPEGVKQMENLYKLLQSDSKEIEEKKDVKTLDKDVEKM